MGIWLWATSFTHVCTPHYPLIFFHLHVSHRVMQHRTSTQLIYADQNAYMKPIACVRPISLQSFSIHVLVQMYLKCCTSTCLHHLLWQFLPDTHLPLKFPLNLSSITLNLCTTLGKRWPSTISISLSFICFYTVTPLTSFVLGKTVPANSFSPFSFSLFPAASLWKLCAPSLI